MLYPGLASIIDDVAVPDHDSANRAHLDSFSLNEAEKHSFDD